MTIKSAEFITSAVKPSQYPEAGLPEIAFAGRSNVGKSSLINLLLNRKALAKVSSSPGKTRTINFFNINNGEFRLVDLPGYGYAKVSKSMSEDWGKMMETFLTKREGLLKVVQLVDSRHEPSAQDRQMYEFLQYYGLDGIVVATKADKLSKNELAKNLALIRKSLKMEKDDVLIATSSLSRTGTEELLNTIEEILLKNKGDKND
jgi:GTP-binding protein